MNRYKDLFDAINEVIREFNEYLVEKCKIPELPNTLTPLNREGYIRFANDPKRGVYFIFGHRQENENDLGVYIGKASVNSTMGNRIRDHRRKYKTPHSDKLICNDGRANPYILLEFATLELESPKPTHMIASLEEFLISKLTGRIRLINGTGNIACRK